MDKLIVFDLDGTLIDTLGDLAGACNYLLKNAGREPYQMDDYRHFVGNGADILMRRIAPDLSEDEVIHWRKNFDDYYGQNKLVLTKPYAGIDKLLGELLAEGYSLAVLSNKPDVFVSELVVKLFPKIPFAAVVGNREGVPPKPDPTALYLMLEELGLKDKSSVFYVGDSDADMLLAKAAEVTAVGVAWGFRGEEELRDNGADFIAEKPEDIRKFLEKA